MRFSFPQFTQYLITNKELQKKYTDQLVKAEELMNNEKYTEAKEILNSMSKEIDKKGRFAAENQKVKEFIKQIDESVDKINEEKESVAKREKEDFSLQ